MARPVKKGLTYFNVDCALDSKIEYIEAVHGITGYAVVIKLWQKIYGIDGYYMPWTKREKFLFSKNTQVSITKLDEIIATCIEEDLFNKIMFESEAILTSKSIQKRYLRICKEAKRKEFGIMPIHDLRIGENISRIIKKGLIQEYGELIQEETQVNSGRNPEESTQSKVKESKVKESKEETPLSGGAGGFKKIDLPENSFNAKARKIWLSEYPDYIWQEIDFKYLQILIGYFKGALLKKNQKEAIHKKITNDDLLDSFKFFSKYLPEFEKTNQLSLKSLSNDPQRICTKIKNEVKNPKNAKDNKIDPNIYVAAAAILEA